MSVSRFSISFSYSTSCLQEAGSRSLKLQLGFLSPALVCSSRALCCAVRAMPNRSWCLKAFRDYNVVPMNGWGTAPPEVQRLWESFKCDRPVRSVMCSENPAAKGCPRRDANVARRVEGVKANQQRKVAEQRREAEQRELEFTNSGRRVVVQWGEQPGSHTVPDRSRPQMLPACWPSCGLLREPMITLGASAPTRASCGPTTGR